MTGAHPHWCSAASCTAYSTELTDLLYHRSEPVVIPSEDDRIKIYVFRMADADGAVEHVELAYLEEPIGTPWYLHEPCGGGPTELVMPIDVAGQVQSAIATCVGV